MKKASQFIVFIIFITVICTTAKAQINGYWNLVSQPQNVLMNLHTINSKIVQEIQLKTNQSTRFWLLSNGQYVFAPTDIFGSGGISYLGYPATMLVQGDRGSGLISFSLRNSDWGQNIQSRVGKRYTVSYVVNWNGSDRFYVAGEGWLYANGAWFGSDIKLKDNIKPLKNSLDKVLKLQGISYNFKKEERCPTCDSNTIVESDMKTEIGLIAQDVEKTVPEVVRNIGKDNLKAIAYQNIVALLIEAIKEQQSQIKELQDKVDKLFRK